MDPALKAPPTQRPRLLPRPPRPAPAWWLFKDRNGRNEGITCLRRRVQIKVFLKFFPTPEEGQGRVCFRLSQRREGGGASGAQDAKKDKPEAKKKEAVRSTPQPHWLCFLRAVSQQANSKEKEKEKDKEKKEEKEKKEAKKADQKKNQVRMVRVQAVKSSSQTQRKAKRKATATASAACMRRAHLFTGPSSSTSHVYMPRRR